MTLPREAGDVAIDVPAGQVLALLGPSGAGKTAALHELAGARGAVMVTTDGRILPRRPFADLAGRLGKLGGRSRRHPDFSSAVQRALAADPQLLLIDAPTRSMPDDARPDDGIAPDDGTAPDGVTSSEGAPSRLARLRADLASFAGSVVIATDDLTVAVALADRIAVFEKGVVTQTGTPDEVVSRPRSKYLARLAGVNLFTGLGRSKHLSIGHSTVTAPTMLKGRVLITLPPTAVTVHEAAPADAGSNVFEALVVGRETRPDGVRLGLSPLDPERGLELFADVPGGAHDHLAPGFELGARVFAEVAVDELTAYEY